MMTLNSEGVNLHTLQVKEIGVMYGDTQGRKPVFSTILLYITNKKYRYPRAGPQIRAWHEIASLSDKKLLVQTCI
jgi:hypothetical protein